MKQTSLEASCVQGTSKQVYERPVLRTVNARTSAMLCLSGDFPVSETGNETEDYGRTGTSTTKSWWF